MRVLSYCFLVVIILNCRTDISKVGNFPICANGNNPPCETLNNKSVLDYCAGFCDQVFYKVKAYSWDRADGKIKCECEK